MTSSTTPRHELIANIITILKQSTRSFTPPLINQIIAQYGKDPFLILIACLLSLRAKDTTTIHVCLELFARAKTPEQLLAIPIPELERILFKTGFYKNKTKVVRHVASELLRHHNGIVPKTYEELTAITGIGDKTANLVLGMAFYTPAICVDTHVHRISNRLGLINTKNPTQTELALKKILPRRQWIDWNFLLVQWGQNVCAPISPRCSSCAIAPHCKRVGVTKSR